MLFDRRSRVLATVRETFWLVVLSVIVLFAFFVGLGTFSLDDIGWFGLAVVALIVLWCVHAVNMRRHRDDPKDPRLVRARERRGF